MTIIYSLLEVGGSHPVIAHEDTEAHRKSTVEAGLKFRLATCIYVRKKLQGTARVALSVEKPVLRLLCMNKIHFTETRSGRQNRLLCSALLLRKGYSHQVPVEPVYD